jgi:hypothetical protein
VSSRRSLYVMALQRPFSRSPVHSYLVGTWALETLLLIVHLYEARFIGLIISCFFMRYRKDTGCGSRFAFGRCPIRVWVRLTAVFSRGLRSFPQPVPESRRRPPFIFYSFKIRTYSPSLSYSLIIGRYIISADEIASLNSLRINLSLWEDDCLLGLPTFQSCLLLYHQGQ